MPFPARFPGSCVRTGARIHPGDSIVSAGRYLRSSLARGVSDIWRTPSGREYYRNRRGLCEDAPCCGCCNA